MSSIATRRGGMASQESVLKFLDQETEPPASPDPTLYRIADSLYFRDADDAQFVLPDGGGTPTVIAAADSPYTILDSDQILLVNTTAGAVTLNMPSTYVPGRKIAVVDSHRQFAANNCTIAAGAGKTINGGATLVLSAAGQGALCTMSQATTIDAQVVGTATSVTGAAVLAALAANSSPVNLNGAALYGLGAVGFGGVQALSGAGAVNVTTLVTMFTSTGGAQALTLADGTYAGQLKIVCHAVDGGSGVLTPATPSGFATLTLTNLYDAGVMIWDGAVWRAVLATGAAAFA